MRQINRWAGNHPIQAASADMLKDALRHIYLRIRGGVLHGPKLYDASIILVVHDEIVMQVADKDVPAVAKIMKECMERAYYAIIGDAIPNEVEVVPGIAWEKA
jgi:DNA polymerase I-like protein with 3'-5' exonuclease and polymerase domains